MEEYRRNTTFLTPLDFLEAAVSYFEWAENTPLQQEEIKVVDKEVVRVNLNKVKAFSKTGLAQYLGMPVSRLDSYKHRKDPSWGEVVALIEETIYNQKFENAAAGLLNSSLISRELGLSDKQEITGGGEGAPPVSLQLVPIKSGTYLPPDNR